MITLTNVIMTIQLITGCHHTCIMKATSLVETGCDHNVVTHCKHDRIVGRNGEWGRYQIKMSQRPNSTYVKCLREYAKRLEKFKELFGESPTKNEIYILWNAPAYLIGPKMGKKIPEKILERSRRFENVLNDII